MKNRKSRDLFLQSGVSVFVFLSFMCFNGFAREILSIVVVNLIPCLLILFLKPFFSSAQKACLSKSLSALNVRMEEGPFSNRVPTQKTVNF